MKKCNHKFTPREVEKISYDSKKGTNFYSVFSICEKCGEEIETVCKKRVK